MTLTHHKLFYAFLGWTALACFLSPWPALATYGYQHRYEGLLTWSLCFILAWQYWKHFEYIYSIILPISILCLLYPFIYSYLGTEWAGWLVCGQVAVAAMCAVGFSICYYKGRNESLLGVFVALIIAIAGFWTGSRSFLVCMIVSIVITEALKLRRGGVYKAFKVVLAILAVVMASVVPFDALRIKLMNTRVSFEGSRAQWAKQAIEISSYSYPWGWGLDTGSELLKSPKGRTAEIDVISDRTHNIFCDVLLWSGSIGLLLFLSVLVFTAKRIWLFHSPNNIACGLGALSVIIFSCMNPFGIPALALFFMCILGVRK